VSGAADRVVGILGGMGPDATVDLMQRILRLTPAEDDGDHLRVLVDNNPRVPSRIAALIDGDGPSPLPALQAMARGLESQGADFLVMPCNTAHHYHADVAAAVDIPFLNLPELVSSRLRRREPRVRRVGLLASSALQVIHLYEPWLEEAGMTALYPEAALQDDLMELIRAVKSGRVEEHGTAALGAAAEQLAFDGADCLLIACTELSVVADRRALEQPVIDAADVLARETVAFARRGREG
jgi:aspartate racemase